MGVKQRLGGAAWLAHTLENQRARCLEGDALALPPSHRLIERSPASYAFTIDAILLSAASTWDSLTMPCSSQLAICWEEMRSVLIEKAYRGFSALTAFLTLAR